MRDEAVLTGQAAYLDRLTSFFTTMPRLSYNGI